MSLYAEDAAVLRNRLEEAGLAETVFDLGWIEEKDLPGVLSSADLGLYLMDDTLLNRTKCPVKLADMLSIGVPVVAEDVGQVPAYVRHRQTGLLYKSGDITAIADGVIEILTDENARKALSTAAEAHIEEQFSWQQLANTAIEAYGLDLQSN
jgi:glycosyltransferase involved in cell wall biosynthesis